MTPQIFIGLGNKTQLHEKFYELIGKYGGRHKLADAIECEIVKQGRYERIRTEFNTNPYMWRKDEIAILKKTAKKHPRDIQHLLPGRTIAAIYKQRNRQKL